MPQFLVAVHHPENYDPSVEDASMTRDINALNDEMTAAGVRIFVGGLQSPKQAKSVHAQPGGEVLITNGLHLKTKEYVGGFWVLEAAGMDDALGWAHKAAVACRATVEVRQFN